jgi:hypothetical protein
MSGKNMKKNTKSKINSTQLITDIIKKSNLVIFIVLVSAGLILVVTTLTDIFIPPEATSSNQTTTTNRPSASSSVTFDQVTIDKLNILKTASDNSGDQTLPAGRINPFSG